MCTGKGNVFMAEKRIIRFEKWILKVVISYAVFIGIGWLLGRIPAEKIGLSEDMFFDLRMFFMLFGPIYLTLEGYSLGRRSIRIRGTFTRKTKDAYGTHQKSAFSKTLRIPRTFSVEQERILLYFLLKTAA